MNNKNEINITKFDSALFNIREQLDYQFFLTPINYNEENEKFLDYYKRGIKYNPQYVYHTFEVSHNSETDTILLQNEAKFTGEEKIIGDAIENIRNEVKMYESIGNDNYFTDYSKMVYGTPKEEYLDTALNILKKDSKSKKENMSYGPDDLRKMICKCLEEYGFVWDVKIMPNMAARISVEPDRKAIYINETKMFSYNDIQRLLIHEIHTHVLRAENGYKRELKIYSSGTANSLIHEEGLALYNEWKNNVLDEFALKLYAARYICCVNIEKSFFDLFDYLIKNGCTYEMAIYIVPRIKRGLTDTKNPGGFIKDYVYFQGMYEVIDALKQNQELYNSMYYGVISLDDVDTLKDKIDLAKTQGKIIYPNSILPKINY